MHKEAPRAHIPPPPPPSRHAVDSRLCFLSPPSSQLHIITAPYPGAGAKGSPARVMRRWLERARPQLGAAARLPRVFVSSRRVDDDVLPRLYARADTVVLPSRGEGWGRPHVEAMAMGRPLIATNFSGPTAFLSDSVAYPLAYDGLRAAEDDMLAADPGRGAGFNPWFAGERWAAPSAAHLRRLMRRAVERPDEARAKGRAARALVLRRFSLPVVAARVRSELDRIERKLLLLQLRAAAAADGGGGVALTAVSQHRPIAPLPLAAAAAAGSEELLGVGEMGRALRPATAIPTRTRFSGKGDSNSGGADFAARVQAARAMGFTGAGGSLQRSLDTLVMTLPEMLRVLEAGRAQPKTALTRLGRGARPDEVEPQRTQPAEEEGEEDDDDDDGSIVLHPS